MADDATLRAQITAEIGDLLAKTKTVEQTLTGLSRTIESGASQTVSSLGQVEKSLTRIDAVVRGTALLTLGQQLTAAVTQPLLDMGRSAVLAADELTRTQIALTTLLRSSEQARTLLAELQQFAAQTPFEFTGLAESAKRILALGFGAQEVIPILRAVGDTVAGLGANQAVFDRIVLALGQMHAKGVVLSQEMRQLAEAGIPAWELLAAKLGTDVAGAMQAVEKRSVDAATGISALLEGMSARFGGLMVEQSKTVTGALSNLHDVTVMLLGAIGQEIVTALRLPEAIQQLATFAQEFLAWFRSLDTTTKQIILVFTGAFAATGPILVAIGAFMTALSVITAPMLVGGAIVAGIAAGVTLIVLNWQKLKDTGLAIWTALRDTVVGVWHQLTSAVDRAVARLSAILESVRAKTEAVTGFFRALYEAVVGHSYIPDMVEQIGKHMELLDVRMVAPARNAALQTGRVLEGAAVTWTTVWSQVASTANYIWGSIAQTVGQSLARMTDEHVRWGEVIKQIGIQALGAVITQVIQLATQWTLAQLGMTAASTAGDAVRTASAVSAAAVQAAAGTASAEVVAGANVAAAATTASAWTGAFAAIAGALAALWASVLAALVALWDVISATLQAIAAAMKATVFGVPIGIAITAALAAGAVMVARASKTAAAALGAMAATAAVITFVPLQHGGIVRRPTLAMVGESGPEAVVPLSHGAGLWAGEQTIVIELDGRELARQVLPWVPGLVRVHVGPV